MLSLSEADFQRMYVYIQKHYGIDLSQKKQLIVSRLSNTLAKMGYANFTKYVDDLVSSRKPEMVTDMLNKLTTNYTYFMREEEHFDYLNKTVLPELAKKHAHDKVLSIWSAGCSSGEEPYTISMYLKEFFGSQASAWDTRILATDISQNILDAAQHPSYHEESLARVPSAWKHKYFVKDGTGSYTIAPVIRQNVIFRTFNLMDPIQFKRRFDLIFCRNVMIYFDMPTKEALIRRFYQATVPGGYLFIGHSESLSKENCPYDYIVPAVYRRSL
ncbi:protein-glutamate O-methyltransferase CheR [Lachnospiraceae bacterium 45-P1]